MRQEIRSGRTASRPQADTLRRQALLLPHLRPQVQLERQPQDPHEDARRLQGLPVPPL